VPAAAGVDQVDGDLGVLDPARSAGVLPLDSDGAGALLHVAGLVDHQHRLVVVQMLHHVVTYLVADLVGIPLRPSEQVLHAIRGPVPGPLGDGPAVLARQVRQQAEYQLPGRRRDSTRVKRQAVRVIRPSNASCQQAGSTL
jgi:hypothetical protein